MSVDPVSLGIKALGAGGSPSASSSATASGGSNYDDDYVKGSFNFAPVKQVNGVNFDPYSGGIEWQLVAVVLGLGAIWYMSQKRK